MKSSTAFTTGALRGLVAVCLVAVAPAAWAQRVQFPTMVDQGAVAVPQMSQAPAPGWTAAPPPGFGTPPPTFSTPPPTFTTPPPAAAAPPAFDPYAAPGAVQAPGAYSPYAPSPYAPAPYAPAPEAYSTTPGYLYPEGIAAPTIFPSGSTFGAPLRFLQDVRLRWTWLSPGGAESLGVQDVETNASFAVPFLKTSKPLVITPGFALHFWDGPVTEAPEFADLPANTYEGYLDTAWYPQISTWLSAQVGVRVGAYTDFNTFNVNSFRTMGRGLGVISLTPTLQVAVGAVFLDRLLIKLLPAGGIIWTPNPDARFEFLFPNPKLAKRVTTLGNTDIWLYAFGEYGGGSWTIERTFLAIPGATFSDQFDYNDIRFGGGIESFGYRGLHGLFEVAYVFERQILYRSGLPNFYPDPTVMLRAGISY